MNGKKMVFLRFDNLQNVDFYHQTISVLIENHAYTFNGKVVDIPNSVIISEGQQKRIAELPKIPRSDSTPGYLRIEELIAVNSGLYHLVRN